LGKQNPKGSPKKKVTFFLDESLPYQFAYWLKRIGYPITSWDEEFEHQQGVKDTPLIQLLGAKGYTWITKDDEAKKEHENDIRAAGISVVWVRGLEREKGKPKKNKISNKEVHRMLTDRLYIIEQEIARSKSAQYYLLYVKTGFYNDLIPVHRKITLEYFFKKHLPKLS